MVIDRLDVDPNALVWFAMQATQKRELEAQDILKGDGVDSFIPMKSELVTRCGHKKIVAKPVIPNLMFVRATKTYMRAVKNNIPYLQFKYRTEAGLYYPIVVPARQMDDFIRLYESADPENMEFFSPDDPAITAGQRVRIHGGGNLDGLEGVLVKIKGRRNRRFSVSIENYTTLVSAIDIDLLEVIK